LLSALAVTVAVPSPLSFTSYSVAGTITLPLSTVVVNLPFVSEISTVVLAMSFLTIFHVISIVYVFVVSFTTGLLNTPVHSPVPLLSLYPFLSFNVAFNTLFEAVTSTLLESPVNS